MVAFLFAIGSGFTIVLSRSINGYLSERTTALEGSFYNYLTGFIGSVILLGIAFLLQKTTAPGAITPDKYIYLTGGIIGVINIIILNVIVPKMSAVIITLLGFIAQLITGMVLDYFLYDSFSVSKCVGCIIIILGFVIYQYDSFRR